MCEAKGVTPVYYLLAIYSATFVSTNAINMQLLGEEDDHLIISALSSLSFFSNANSSANFLSSQRNYIACTPNRVSSGWGVQKLVLNGSEH